VIIGLLYPFFDYKLGEAHKYRREWSSVMRCIAVFVGINHASAVSFVEASNFQYRGRYCGIFWASVLYILASMC